ncbi:hypothetical protein RUM43_014744 [Polyplax serrata]|uniref:Glutamate-rich WD repeat-containing protein 1 n=1 Tax=Polyplax serrata TaxID=468196 RepID=A0AAN8NVC3_POLSC
MKKGIHSGLADVMDFKTTNCSGYILNYPSLKAPVFINENVWKQTDEEYSKRKCTPIDNVSKTKNKRNSNNSSTSSKIFDMLNYSSGKYNEMYTGGSNKYETGFYRPLTSPDQIKMVLKKNSQPDENIDSLKNYLTKAFNICSRDEFTKKQIQLNKNRHGIDKALVKADGNVFLNENEPPPGILKNNSNINKTSSVESKMKKEVNNELLKTKKCGKTKVKGKHKAHTHSGNKGKDEAPVTEGKIYPPAVRVGSQLKMIAKHRAPCLSFDIIQDELGTNRTEFPHTCYLVAGTQASKSNENCILVMKTSNLHKTQKKEEEEEDDEDDNEDSDEEENEETRPRMDYASMAHYGCVNRIRSTIAKNTILAASWSEQGKVNIWDLKQQIQAVNDMKLLAKYRLDDVNVHSKPLFTFSGHQSEGFALDWCPTSEGFIFCIMGRTNIIVSHAIDASIPVLGMLVTGDCKRNIHLWNVHESGWKVDQRPLIGHTDSVEDLQWSPNERHVLCSASVDKTMRIWDTRATGRKACMVTVEKAHESDVNVIHWNRNDPFIVSGGDDGVIHVWDLRQLKTGKSVATFKHHTAPVTTVEWHPTESTIFATGGEDNQIALWDLSVEKDDEAMEEDVENVPPQLLFIHQGQQEIKELHWHTHIPGLVISTALNGFNIFRTISV